MRLWNYLRDIISNRKNSHVVILTLIYCIVGSILPLYHVVKSGMPLLRNFPTLSTDLVNEIYPEELEITINGGQLSTNVVEPYYITTKVSRLREILEAFSPNSGKDLPKVSTIRLVTIDTQASVEDFERYQSLVLLTRENFVYVNDDEVTFRSYSDTEIGDIVVTKEFIKNKLNEFIGNDFLKFLLRYGVYALFLFVPLGLFISFFLLHALFALLVYIISRILRTGVGFWTLYGYVVLINYPFSLWSTSANELGLVWSGVYLIANDISTIVFLGISYLLLTEMKGKLINEK
jgi:Protein of unknown function (DUF1189)